MATAAASEASPGDFSLKPPLVVSVLGGAIVLTFVLLGQYAPEAHAALFDQFAIVPARIAAAPGEALAPLLGHVFFHYGVLHLLMNGLAFMQVAPFLARRVGDVRFLALFFASALGGALMFVAIHPASQVGMVGASGAICGLFGAYFLAVRPTPRAAFADPQIRSAMLGFVGVNVVLMAFLPLPIAWEAHLGGFVAGVLLYMLMARAQGAGRGPWG